jgi:hypothetical protein
VQVAWRARLEQHLGTFAVELIDARAADLIANRVRLYACQLICDHLRLLPERDPHDRLLALAVDSLDDKSPRDLAIDLARFELTLLDDLGFGLDLSACAVSGTTEDMSGMIEFLNPTPWQSAIGRGGNFFYAPKDGLALLFPASLLHFVHPHASAIPRVSIAFNLNIVPRPRA